MSRILVRSNSPEQAKAIQEEMFRRGGKWAVSGSQETNWLNAPAYTLYDNKAIYQVVSITSSLRLNDKIEVPFEEFVPRKKTFKEQLMEITL